MPTALDQGLCIRQWEWSETSQTVELFCRESGLVRGLAKGSRRPKSAYDGGLEVLTRGDLGLIVRPSTDLALITEWSVMETFRPIRKSLGAYHAGLYIADLIHHAIHDHDPHPALYDAAVESLRLIQSAADAPYAVLKFHWSLLVDTGYRPELDADVATGERLAPESAYTFSPGLGGFFAQTGGEPVQDAGTTWRVRSQTLDLLRRLSGNELVGAAVGGVEPHAMDRANRLLASYLRYVLGTEPPTMRVVFGSGLSR
ncbi:MAG: DNA repair protein RecO [Phycisphaerales bacterium]|nr:DNA repair protein RecO [Phycisphaerales bacterium]